jgi:cytidylate kinase
MIVTISREFGAGGLAIATAVASALHYELVTDQYLAPVAAHLGTSREDIDARAESDPPLSERILTDMSDGTADAFVQIAPVPAVDFDEAVHRAIERAMRARADEGDAVILGRMGSAVLAGMPALLRAFVHAGRAWRLQRVAAGFSLDAGRAAAEVDRVDAQRRRLASERYNIVWGDRRYYDVIVDASSLGVDAAAAAIVAAAKHG